MKAQVALKDVEEATANENITLRGLEEVYQKNPGDAELRNFINKRKQTILEHKEVYVIVKSQHDKSIAGIYKIDHEIATMPGDNGSHHDGWMAK
ncbi:DNA damage-inducible protein 1 [Fusarium oxysporum f. sp. albedinis]|nr:DNA damage-inducible protein 1 [Fusarium oxysporum f. sp. albedinis]